MYYIMLHAYYKPTMLRHSGIRGLNANPKQIVADHNGTPLTFARHADAVAYMDRELPHAQYVASRNAYVCPASSMVAGQCRPAEYVITMA